VALPPDAVFGVLTKNKQESMQSATLQVGITKNKNHNNQLRAMATGGGVVQWHTLKN